MKTDLKKGFTLIEVLIVVTIIAIVVAVVMMALEESRQKSRNAARVTQVKEYQKALNFYWLDQKGVYPCRNNACAANSPAFVCLGDYPGTGCWQSGTSAAENAAVNNALSPQYMPMVSGETRVFKQGANSYIGMVYRSTHSGRGYQILYFLEGQGRPCLIDNTTASGGSGGDDTLCTLTITP